jgi:threonine aldolase
MSWALCRDEMSISHRPDLCLENTHNAREEMRWIRLIWRTRRCAVDAVGCPPRWRRVFTPHWPGRWSQGIPPRDLVALCLSKGLGAPVGSVVCGSKEFIRKARHGEKILGGCLAKGVDRLAGSWPWSDGSRLAEDHGNAALCDIALEGGMDVESCA